MAVSFTRITPLEGSNCGGCNRPLCGEAFGHRVGHWVVHLFHPACAARSLAGRGICSTCKVEVKDAFASSRTMLCGLRAWNIYAAQIRQQPGDMQDIAIIAGLVDLDRDLRAYGVNEKVIEILLKRSWFRSFFSYYHPALDAAQPMLGQVGNEMWAEIVIALAFFYERMEQIDLGVLRIVDQKVGQDKDLIAPCLRYLGYTRNAGGAEWFLSEVRVRGKGWMNSYLETQGRVFIA